MKRVYTIESGKKAELMKLLETDPYAESSFARAGYKLREGASLGEDKTLLFLYLSADEGFFKAAEQKLKPLLAPFKHEDEKRILEKILKEEEEAESGFGTIFGGG